MRDKPIFAAKPVHFFIAPLALLLAGCGRAVLNPAGDVALQQRDLIYISTGLMLLIIVPVMILIVLFAWRYRKGGDGTYDPKFHHSTSLELVIWSAPLLIIIALGALTWSSTHLLDPFRPLNRISASKPSDPAVAPLRVQVVSLDWKWLFIYPDQGVATVNELVLPVDREVRFDITSSNMMNTFYAPTMAGMVYAMPGMRSTLHAVLNRPGEYEGFSANYSGAGFSDMRFKLRGVSAAEFDRWVGGAKASARPLNVADYMALEKPSEKVAIVRFNAVAPNLFERVVLRCVAPGTSCATGAHGRHGDKPAAAGAPPPSSHGGHHGDRPEGALLKEPSEIEPGANVTKPPSGAPPGATKPSSPKNRDMSSNTFPAAPDSSVVALG